MSLHRVLFLLCLAGLSATAFAEDAHLFRIDGAKRIHVLASIDGKGPFDFLLDTGAGRTTINRSIVYHLALEPHPFRTQRVRTATGIVAAQIFELGSIEALGRRLRLGTIPALGDPTAGERYGILGVDLLRGRVLAVSRGGGGIRLLRSPVPFQAAGWSTYQGRPVGRGSLALDVTVGDIRMPAIVDTGASDTVVNIPAMQQLLANGGFLEAGSGTSVMTSAGQRRGSVIRTNEPKSINDTPWEVDRLIVSDLPIFTFLGAKRVPAMILGMDLLDGKDFAIDFQGWTLYLRTDVEEQAEAALDDLD